MNLLWTIFLLLGITKLIGGVFFFMVKNGELRKLTYQRYFSGSLVWFSFAAVLFYDLKNPWIGITTCSIYLITGVRLLWYYKQSLK